MSETKTEKPATKRAAKKTGEKSKPAATTKAKAAAAGGLEINRVLKVTKPLMQGDDVQALQRTLIEKNYHCGVSGANGIYGKDTAYAVRCFQAANRLIVDGKAGKFTVAALGGTWKG